MASYRISGVWKDSNDKITHYAFHLIEKNSISRMQKKTKTEAVALLEINGNSATTWVWNYRFSNWNIGEDVHQKIEHRRTRAVLREGQ